MNLNIDDGYKEFTINNDPDRVIRFNPCDIGILTRVETAIDNILKIEAETPNDQQIDAENIEAASKELNKIDDYIKDQIDYIFNSKVSDAVFGNQSPQSTVKGIALYERFLNAVIPEMTKEISKEQKASKQHIEKYTKGIV